MPRKTISLEACCNNRHRHRQEHVPPHRPQQKRAQSFCARSCRATRSTLGSPNMPRCLIGMEACVGAHHFSWQLKALDHDARPAPARYVRPYSKGSEE